MVDRLGPLNAFVQAAEARSFTGAGRRLGISSSAVGKAIARLEARLGVRLFHRNTRTIALTPEGAVLLDRCTRIFTELDAAEAELSSFREKPRGSLRVSLPLIGMLMMPALGAFVREHPEIELDLDFTDRIVDVIEEGLDVVIRTGDAADSNLLTRTAGHFTHRVVAAPGYLQRHGTPTTPGDLRDHICLLHRFPSTGKIERWPFTEGARELDVDLPRSTIASTIEPLIALAEQGVGFACVPDFSVARQMAAGSLVPVLTDHLTTPGTVRLLWPSSRHTSPKIKLFVDYMARFLFSHSREPRGVADPLQDADGSPGGRQISATFGTSLPDSAAAGVPTNPG